MFDIKIDDGITKALTRLSRKGTDFTPVMARIEQQILKPIRNEAWTSSGLNLRSGQLFDAVATWHGKSSAGITLKSRPGKDLIIAKALTHTQGAAKGSFSKRGKKQWPVKGYTRRGRSGLVSVKKHQKKIGPSPWGNIPARPFFPKEQQLKERQGKIVSIIQGYLSNV